MVIVVPRDGPKLSRGWSGKAVLGTTNLREDPESTIANISTAGIKKIAEELRVNGELQRLDLRHNYFGAPEANVLSKGLAFNTGLATLDLHNNELGDLGVIDLAAALMEQQVLQNLQLTTCDIGDNGAIALAEWIASSITCQNLVLKDNRIGEEGVMKIGQALHENRSMKRLNLSQNEARDNGAIALATAVAAGGGHPLLHLDLGSNSVTDEGVKAFAEAFTKGCRLKTLTLRINQMCDPGCLALCNVLNDNMTLTDLDIGGNVVRDASIDCVKELMLKNACLKRFNLEDNFFTDTAGEQFLQRLEMNDNLQMIWMDLKNNKISEMRVDMIYTFLRTHANFLKEKEKAEKSRVGSKQRHGSKRRASQVVGDFGRRGSTKGSSSGPGASKVPVALQGPS